MRILYGVQGTGNGHLSRARAMVTALEAHPEIEVQWLFSGRPRDRFFEMEAFGDFWLREGLTFVTEGGRINQLATVRAAKPKQLLRDIRELPVKEFDLVITDFEPVTAWAAKRAGVPCLGLGHQYAFNFSIPAPRFNWLARMIMRAYAPAKHSLGLHWHHFGQPILPPIAHAYGHDTVDEHILVYLPFESGKGLMAELARVSQRFIVYGQPTEMPCADNIELKAPSVEGFRTDVATSRAVICNSGFELIAETLAIGKPILTRPLSGQFEQEANAMALEELELATVVKRIDANSIRKWLDAKPSSAHLQWPDVAGGIARWIAEGRQQSNQALASALWEQVTPARTVTAELEKFASE